MLNKELQALLLGGLEHGGWRCTTAAGAAVVRN